MRKLKFITVLAVVISLMTACRSNPASTVRTLDDVADKTIGVVAGTSAAHYAPDYGTVRVYDSVDAMMGDLTAGVIDCAFADKSVAQSYARRGKRIRILSEPVVSRGFCIAAAAESRDMIRDINAALESLRDEGVLKALEDKYILGRDAQLPAVPDLSGYSASLRLALPKEGFAPYSDFADEGAFGFDAALALYICEKLGVSCVVVPVESEKLVDTVRFGRADFAMGDIDSGDDASGSAEFSVVYTTVEIAVLTRR